MPDDLDAMLLRLRAQHSEPARRNWKSPIEARLVDDDEDDDERDEYEPHTQGTCGNGDDGAGNGRRRSGSSGREREPRESGSETTAAPDADGTAVHSVIKGAHDAGAGRDVLPQQRPGSASIAAEAPPSVPGHFADGERSPEVDPYSPDRSLYSPEWLAEFDRRCKAAVAEMTAAIERARQRR